MRFRAGIQNWIIKGSPQETVGDKKQDWFKAYGNGVSLAFF